VRRLSGAAEWRKPGEVTKKGFLRWTVPRRNAVFFSLRLQFSLRLLMLALTAFAIGFPIWYRWPYQTVVEER